VVGDPLDILPLILILIFITENVGEILGIHLDVRADFIKGMITLSIKFGFVVIWYLVRSLICTRFSIDT
jgi:hypothetical protein